MVDLIGLGLIVWLIVRMVNKSYNRGYHDTVTKISDYPHDHEILEKIKSMVNGR